MTTSRIPALIDYLIARFQAAPALGQATPPVIIYDGPATTADPSPLALHVGVDDAFAPGAPNSADSQQSGGGLGQHRDEVVTIHCTAVAWGGTDDMKTMRIAAFAIAAAVEDLVRTDTTQFGGNGAALARPGVTGMTLQQNNTTTGAVAQVMFQIDFKTLIGA